MYAKHFGLRELPFNNTPDPRFFYPTPEHEEALATLIYTVSEGKGYVLLTGEVGAGKTLISRLMLRHFQERIAFATVNHSCETAHDLISLICAELDLDVDRTDSTAQLIHALQEFLLARFASNIPVVLVLDDAQNLPRDAFELLRTIGNLESDEAKLLQVAILGQPELRNRFQASDMRQLRQRLFRSFHLPALNHEQCAGYVRHRLKVAGATEEVFEKSAIDGIYRFSHGLPRLINTVCDNAMLSAYSADRKTIDGPFIETVIAQMMPVGADDEAMPGPAAAHRAPREHRPAPPPPAPQPAREHLSHERVARRTPEHPCTGAASYLDKQLAAIMARLSSLEATDSVRAGSLDAALSSMADLEKRVIALEQDLAPLREGYFEDIVAPVCEQTVERALAPLREGGFERIVAPVCERTVERALAPLREGGFEQIVAPVCERAVHRALAPLHEKSAQNSAAVEKIVERLGHSERDVSGRMDGYSDQLERLATQAADTAERVGRAETAQAALARHYELHTRKLELFAGAVDEARQVVGDVFDQAVWRIGRAAELTSAESTAPADSPADHTGTLRTLAARKPDDRNARIDRLVAQTVEITERVGRIDLQLAHLAAEQGSQAGELRQVAGTVEEARRTANLAATQSDDTEKRVGRLDADVARLADEYEAQARQLERVTGEADQACGETGTVVDRIADTEKRIGRLDADVTRLTDEHESHARRLEQVIDAADQACSEAGKVTARLAGTEEHIGRLDADLTRLADEHESHARRLERVTGTADQACGEAGKVAARLAGTEEHIGRLDADVARLADEQESQAIKLERFAGAVDEARLASREAFDHASKKIGRAEQLARDVSEQIDRLECRLPALDSQDNAAVASDPSGLRFAPAAADLAAQIPDASQRLRRLMSRSQSSLGQLRSLLGSSNVATDEAADALAREMVELSERSGGTP